MEFVLNSAIRITVTCVKDIDSPRSKRYEDEYISHTGVSGRSSKHAGNISRDSSHKVCAGNSLIDGLYYCCCYLSHSYSI